MTFAITVTGKDRPGIIAALTEAILQAKGNLEDASMTILEGEFAMIVLAAFQGKGVYQKLADRLQKVAGRFRLAVSIKEIKYQLKRGEKHQKGTIPYVISVFGKDRAGIVYHVAKLLAARRLNITDLNSKIIGSGEKSAYSLILEVDIPKRGESLTELKRALSSIQKRLKVELAINPVDLIQA